MRIWLLVLLALAGAAPVAAQPVAGWAVCDAVWHDASRGRGVPVRIRLPRSGAKVPLILFSHGLGGSLETGKLWAQAWAEAGFAVINVQHPGSDIRVPPAVMVAALNPQQLAERARDISFVRDEVARRPAEGACDLRRIDLGRVGVAGHSFGSRTALAIAGQLPPPGAGAATLADSRFVAAVALSPSPATAGSDAEAFAPVRIPVFSLTGSADRVDFLPDISPVDRERPFRDMPPGEKYLLSLARADHVVFGGTDSPQPAGSVPVVHIRAEVIRTTTLFWRWRLLGDMAARAGLDATELGLHPGDRFEMR